MNVPHIILTVASDEAQAVLFRELLRRRLEFGLYPRETEFRVFADPEGGRVGSGGGTLWALHRLLGELGIDSRDCRGFFEGHRILMLHAGGQSRRLPLYAPEGKLFAPVPVPSSSLLSPCVLDLELALFLRYPWKKGELVVAAGDAMIDFDVHRLPEITGDICGFAKPASFWQGARHGVFKFDPVTGSVLDYYQKAAPDELGRLARIEGTDECALDLGIVALSPRYCEALLEFGRLEWSRGLTLIEALGQGQLAFELYAELMSAGLTSLGWEAYRERLRPTTRLEQETLRALYQRFRGFGLRGVMTKSASFVHFGSLAEFPEACRALGRERLLPFYAQPTEEIMPEVGQMRVVFHCDRVEFSAPAEASLYAENCTNTRVATTGSLMLGGLRDYAPPDPLPGGLCIEERSITVDGKTSARVRLVYGIFDTFKALEDPEQVRFCGQPLVRWLAERGLRISDVWGPDEVGDLCAARLFPAIVDDAFLAGYWAIPSGSEPTFAQVFRGYRRYSIAELNRLGSAAARDRERTEIRRCLLRKRLLSGKGFHAVTANDFRQLFSEEELVSLADMAARTDDPLLYAYRATVVASALGIEVDPSAGSRISFTAQEHARPTGIAVKEDQIVWARSPVRFDLAGGWTDTPPYTNRRGGQVVNVAVDLNGQPPIQVFVRRTREPFVRIHSIDLGVTETITRAGALRDYANPTSPFALPKAALCLLGVGRALGPEEQLDPELGRLGGGLEITLLCAVPKGSGLGTSSILAGAILSALQRFFGIAVQSDELFLEVLDIEQMLTTGGGWQDQIGGLVGGVKYLESRPGLLPTPAIHQLDPFLFEERASTATMTLFYTGITRLAKHLLADVVGRVNGQEPAYLFTHDCLKSLALGARDAIAFRDRLALAEILSASFRENILIHPSTSNPEIDRLLMGTQPHYRGMKLLGAGGGGFALFISETARAADALRETLRVDFEDARARLVEFSLNKPGLVVTVS
jgi:galactokinase/mevalonate kinase-like predicted kinase